MKIEKVLRRRTGENNSEREKEVKRKREKIEREISGKILGKRKKIKNYIMFEKQET
jgi:hypothetical protein